MKKCSTILLALALLPGSLAFGGGEAGPAYPAQQCGILFCEEKDLITLSCGHTFCRACLKHLIDDAIKEESTEQLKCPDPSHGKHKQPLTDEDILKITKNDLGILQRLHEIKKKKQEITPEMELYLRGHARHCPDCRTYFQKTEEGCDAVHCPGCPLEVCYFCGEAHGRTPYGQQHVAICPERKTDVETEINPATGWGRWATKEEAAVEQKRREREQQGQQRRRRVELAQAAEQARQGGIERGRREFEQRQAEEREKEAAIAQVAEFERHEAAKRARVAAVEQRAQEQAEQARIAAARKAPAVPPRPIVAPRPAPVAPAVPVRPVVDKRAAIPQLQAVIATLPLDKRKPSLFYGTTKLVDVAISNTIENFGLLEPGELNELRNEIESFNHRGGGPKQQSGGTINRLLSKALANAQQ